MRWYDTDTPGKYESTFNIAGNEKYMKHLKKNTMYPTNTEGYITHKTITGKKCNEKILKISKHEKIIDYDIFIDAFNINEGGANLGKLGVICPEIKKAVIFGSYKKYLLLNTKFRDYCRAAINTSHERIFLYFLELGDEQKNLVFNKVCQK